MKLFKNEEENKKYKLEDDRTGTVGGSIAINAGSKRNASKKKDYDDFLDESSTSRDKKKKGIFGKFFFTSIF